MQTINRKTFLSTEAKRFNTFVNLALVLAALTGIEVILIFLPLVQWLSISILFILAIVKFACVLAWFMHLIYDHKILLVLMIFGVTLGTLTILALISLHPPDRVDRSIHSSLQYNQSTPFIS